MGQMRAAGIVAFGDEVRMLDLAAPASPAPDEVVISVRAAGVGNWDEIVRVGDWDVGRRPPLALGVEAAGIVDAVGDDVSASPQATRCSPTHCRCDTRARGRSGLSLRPHLSHGSRASSRGRRPPPSRCPRSPGPGAHRGRTGPGRRVGPRARRRRRDRRTCRAARDRARSDSHRDRRPLECGARPQLRRASSSSTITIPTGRPACETHLQADAESGAAVNAARGGSATALQAVARDGRLATITGDPPHARTRRHGRDIYVRADGARLAELVAALAEGPSRSTSQRYFRSQKQPRRSGTPSPAAPEARMSSRSIEPKGMEPYGAQRARPVATNRKRDRRQSGTNRRIGIGSQPTATCRRAAG